MKKNKLWILFWSVFKISACTFGGGFVIVPLMRDRFVKQLKWIEEDEMLDLTAIAQSSPGAIAVNGAISVGYRVAKIPGALVAILGSILPPLIIITIISKFYDAFRSNQYVSLAMKGMLAGIAAVICDVVIKMGTDIFKTKRLLYILILFGSFVLTRFLNVSVMWIILACILIGIIDNAVIKKEETK